MADKTTFGDEPSAKKPTYDQAFFLALAAKGKDAWNAWRRDPANKDVRVTYAGIDFSEAPKDEIDFSWFEFGDNADFSRCRWRGAHELGAPVTFTRGRASFAGAAFGSGANFTGAAFGEWADFYGSSLRYFSRFTDAVFDRATKFTGAAFGELADFTHPRLG